MISGFDHVVIAVRDLEAGVRAYEMLLGREAARGAENEGVATATIAAGNAAVELMAPVGEGAMAARLTRSLADGEGLKSLVFAVDDIEGAHRRCERLGLAPEPIAHSASFQRFRVSAERTHGVRLFFLGRAPAGAAVQDAAQGAAQHVGAGASSHALALDHIVIRTSDCERAAALYGARLGLDMRLDRTVAGHRLMFFRCGDAIVEVAHEAGLERDRLWGLSWRVANADAAQARLAGASVNVSEVRAGKKPGTRVFTVRDSTSGVPTLMIEASRRPDRR